MTKRDAIIGLYRAGTPVLKIIKQLKVPKSTVYDVVRRCKELDNTKDYPESGRALAHVRSVSILLSSNSKRDLRKLVHVGN